MGSSILGAVTLQQPRRSIFEARGSLYAYRELDKCLVPPASHVGGFSFGRGASVLRANERPLTPTRLF
jgi:hypothetical protein